MTELDAILKAICESPGDDTPRLCYADAIEDTDPARAEFVRVQVELEKPVPRRGVCSCDGSNTLCRSCHDEGDWESNDAKLRRRERELHPQGSIEDVRIAKLFGLSEGNYREKKVRWEYQRGFLDSITCSWPDFLRVADALIWRPWQRCPVCKDGFAANYNYVTSRWVKVKCTCCKKHGGTGRVPRPFPPTAQPITRVTLTTIPGGIGPHRDASRFSTVGESVTFDRVKCPTCHGLQPRIISDPHKQCDRCHGTPLNEWHCEKLGRVTFVMPEVEQRRPIAHGQTWRYGAHGVT